MQLSDRHCNWVSDFFPLLFCSQQFTKLTHWNLAGQLLCVSAICSSWPARDQNTCMLIWGHVVTVARWNQKCGVLRCQPLLLCGRSRMKAAVVLPRDPIQSAPRRGQSKGCSSLGTELPLLGALFAFKLWLFFVSGQIYCRGMLASLLALNSVVLTSLLS